MDVRSLLAKSQAASVGKWDVQCNTPAKLVHYVSVHLHTKEMVWMMNNEKV